MAEGDDREAGKLPRTSIIINTDGRASALALALESLRYLRHPEFEVVVVTGPTPDDTPKVLEAWRGQIKVGHCPERNLARSRNIGIALASGEIVAFLDDDSVPEPEWLADVIPPFHEAEVGVSGGFLHDHTGKTYQWTFGTANRLGSANTNWQRPAPEFNFPLSFTFPHVMANSAFRRSAIIDVGGFDEEYDYYLDETDIICRLVDHGWRVAQLANGFVHHKFMASTIRTSQRVLTSRYSVLKNKLYFMLRNSRTHVGFSEIIAEMQKFTAEHRRAVAWCVGEGLLPETARRNFADDEERAWSDGLERGLRAERSLPPLAQLAGSSGAFLAFEPLRSGHTARCIVFSSVSYPPDSIGGIGRYVHHLSRAIAALGHQVHVITQTDTHDRIDFEDGVWVHRLVVREHDADRTGPYSGIPRHIWNYSRTVLDEVRAIATRRTVDCVVTPIWDVEGIAFGLEPSIPHAVSLHTTLHSYLDSNPHRRNDVRYMLEFGQPMIEAERRLLVESRLLLANSKAIVKEIEAAYAMRLLSSRHVVVPHGIDDWKDANHDSPPRLPDGHVRVVFVGRFEPRKGVDALMQIAPQLLQRHPEVWLDFVGNDKVEGVGGRTWRAIYEDGWPQGSWRKRVAVHGEVSDSKLRGFYAAADVVVAPSRFESFGLVHLEAMMYGKPIVGSRAGGMMELIENGTTGLLAEPGDAASLDQCLERLISDAPLRMRLGAAARATYLERFTSDAMASAVVEAVSKIEPAADIAGPNLPDRVDRPDDIHPTASPGPHAASKTTPVVVVAGCLFRYDAISAAALDTLDALAADPAYEVTLLTSHSELAKRGVEITGDAPALLLNPRFRNAELIIYHFGIYSPLFDVMPLGNGKARQAAFFHNITPAEFVPTTSVPTIEKSHRQLHNLRHMDIVWPVSRTNVEALAECDIEAAQMDIIPLAVSTPAITRLGAKGGDRVEILFLSRIVKAKGIIDLIEALGALPRASTPAYRLRIAGNLSHSDSNCVATVSSMIAAKGIDDHVDLLGTVDDAERDRLLASSHILAIPSYHEGFCKPVIEGLRAGCIPVGYAAHNLRYIADGLARMVPTGDVAALSDALATLISSVHAAQRDPRHELPLDRGPHTIEAFDAAAARHVDQFNPARIASLTLDRIRALLHQPPSCRRLASGGNLVDRPSAPARLDAP